MKKSHEPGLLQHVAEGAGATVLAAISLAAPAAAATAGASYQIETDLRTLDDTMVDLVDTDRSSVLVENDDDDRDPNTYASYIEWTCPASGTYYIMVQGYGSSTGTFGLTLTQGGAGGGGAGSGDPCNGGITFQGGACVPPPPSFVHTSAVL